MKIHVNGEAKDIDEATTVAGLLEMLELAGRRLAVECNGEIIPRSQHADRSLVAGDRVEIVHAIGGG